MKKFLPIFIPILVIAALVWLSKTENGNKTANLNSTTGGVNSIVGEETSFNFGEMSMANGKVSHAFKMKNTGAESVNLAKLYTSCMCTVAEFITANGSKGPFGMPGHGFVPSLNQVVEPGQDFEIKVTFDPAAHGPAGVGPVNRVVYLEQKDGSKIQLYIVGMVKP